MGGVCSEESKRGCEGYFARALRGKGLLSCVGRVPVGDRGNKKNPKKTSVVILMKSSSDTIGRKTKRTSPSSSKE